MPDELAGQDTPAVDSEVPQVEESTPPEQDTAAPQEEPKPVKTFTQEELDAIVQKRLAKAEAKAAREREQLLKAQIEQLAPKPERPSEPKREQFASDEEWIDAKVDFKLAQRDNAARQEQQRQSADKLTQTTEELYAKAEKVRGFDRDVFEELPLTPAIANAIIESDVAAQLMAYMTTNPEEVERIARLSPIRQVVELGKLETKVTTAKPQISKAPTPIDPITTSRAATKAVSDMSQDEYMAWRRKQGARW